MKKFLEKALMALVVLLAAVPVVLAVVVFAHLGEYWLIAILVAVAVLALVTWWRRRLREKKLGLRQVEPM